MAQNLPSPSGSAPLIPKEKLLRQLQVLGDLLNAGTLLIDVRGAEHAGGTISGSLNAPAQTFLHSLPAIYRLCIGDEIAVMARVIVYCEVSREHAPRCASWFIDHIKSQDPRPGALPEVFVLDGGLRGWIGGGESFTAFVDGFVPSYWSQVNENGKRQGITADQGVVEGASSKRSRNDDDGVRSE